MATHSSILAWETPWTDDESDMTVAKQQQSITVKREKQGAQVLIGKQGWGV